MSEVFIPKYISKYNKSYRDKNKITNEKIFTPKYESSRTRRLYRNGSEQFRSID